MGWGWYHSILVLDDFSRFVLASDLKPDMTAHSISDVVEQAAEFTGTRQVPVEDRTKFLSDHDSGHLARVFEEYVRVLEIRHIYCAQHPSPPATAGEETTEGNGGTEGLELAKLARRDRQHFDCAT